MKPGLKKRGEVVFQGLLGTSPGFIRKAVLLGSLLFFLSFSATAGDHPLVKRTKVTGQLNIEVARKHLEVELNYQYVPVVEGISEISLYLTKEVVMEHLQGKGVKRYSFDKNNEKIPFGILTIEFEDALRKGQPAEFSLTYAGPSSKMFFTDYNWIDVDPDFMILPVFTDQHVFDYKIRAGVDDSRFLFIDAQAQRMAASLNVQATAATYIASIVAGSGMKFTRIEEGKNSVNIISNKTDSIVQYLGNKSLEILDYFNTSFGNARRVSSFSLLYRPMPDSVFRTMRNLSNDRLIMFTSNHEKISTLAHEISHFWWNRGNDFNMEKWLDESFATYSELKYVRYSEGQERFEKELERLQEASSKLPPLLGADRFGKGWSGIFYLKGPYLLFQLEESLGQDAFEHFLSKLNEQEVNSTHAMLEVLEKTAGKEHRDRFYQQLNE